MQKYRMYIRESILIPFDVEAESEKQAKEIVMNKYHDRDFDEGDAGFNVDLIYEPKED